MYLKSILSAGLFAAITAVSFSVGAADPDKVAEPKAEAGQADNTPGTKKKVKPHSHMEEKTGMPQPAPAASSDKPDAAKDQSKHYHPRDMK